MTAVLDGPATAAARVIALQRTPRDVLHAAIDVAHSVVECDRAYVATPDGADMRLSMSTTVRDPRFYRVRFRPGHGMGGLVLLEGRPMRVEDYAHDPRITTEYVPFISGTEGLHGVICVPIRGTGGAPAALLYAARDAVADLGERAVDALMEIAARAEIGLQVARERVREIELERLRCRQRLAAELHASVGQNLFAIGVSAQRLLRGYAGQTGVWNEELRQLDAAAADARSRLRELLRGLSETDGRLAFDARLDGALRVFETRTGCRATLVRRGELESMPDDVEDLLLDVALEGLLNAVKYQSAQLALVFVEQRSCEVRLSVQSEGGAARAEIPQGAGTGCGLRMLRERARRLRGNLELVMSSDGPVLRLQVPLPLWAT
jgi:signal transduction histidine kinase